VGRGGGEGGVVIRWIKEVVLRAEVACDGSGSGGAYAGVREGLGYRGRFQGV